MVFRWIWHRIISPCKIETYKRQIERIVWPLRLRCVVKKRFGMIGMERMKKNKKKTYKISDVEQGRFVDRMLRARNKIIQKLFDSINHKLNGTRLILKRRTTSENLSLKNPRVLLKSTSLFYESIDVYQLKRDGCICKFVAPIFTNYRYKW